MADKINITIDKGSHFAFSFIWKDEDGNTIDLTGYTAAMQARKNYKSTDLILDLTTENGGIEIDEDADTVTVIVPDTMSSTIAEFGALYDLELISPEGLVTRVIEGRIKFRPEITQQ
jgi:hypothetical protein